MTRNKKPVSPYKGSAMGGMFGVLGPITGMPDNVQITGNFPNVVTPLKYPVGVLTAQSSWDAKSVYELQNPGNTGIRVPMSSLKIPTTTNLPSGWSLVPFGTANAYTKLTPATGASPFIGYDLSRFIIYPNDTSVANIEISDCYFGDGFVQTGAGSETPWIRSNFGWNVHHCTVQLSGVDKNMNHWLYVNPGGSAYRNRISGFPDDPIVNSGTYLRTLSQIYENYVFDPVVPAGNHADFISVDGGNVKIFRNLLRVSDPVKYTGFNDAFRIDSQSVTYAAEITNNVVEGWETTNYTNQYNMNGAGTYNVNVHDNVFSKGTQGINYTRGSGGIINSSNNIDTLTGNPTIEYPISNLPSMTTKGTPTAAVVGTACTVSGEVWNMPQAAVYYQWVLVDGSNQYTKPGNGASGNASYTPVSGDVGKTLGRVTLYQTGGNLWSTSAISNTVVVTAT